MLKKVCTGLFALALTVSLTQLADAAGATHTIQKGESLSSISDQYAIPAAAIKRMNNLSSDSIVAGDKLEIPASVSNEEKDLLARLIHAEAKGESYAGKVAVGTVVLNRVDSDLYPDSVNDVVYERSASGHYAFSPVLDGAISNKADSESNRAAEEALQFRGQGQNSLYFYNPETATSKWVSTREQTIVIGNHVFAK
ncbi:cell wall hydrolase [Alkalicoccobacillus porphyridii]|uniref:LysM peptidoglycan-binding domain-containing protein n=1 Tax=Alkalicoccobacillus porphyridii TaxID=2597270 RepID=A0A553ZXE3_9BACI|nr:cell wall hydrolase [Alkalicoccobacillus porphyridii]TSB46119.1 LysM peptidoglycan-binding domain-containing protein [Alkalicoccobacillus porphyridii]